MARKNKFKTRDSVPTTGLPKKSPSRRLNGTAKDPSDSINPAQSSVQPSALRAAPPFVPLAPTPVPASTPLTPPKILALSSTYNLCPLKIGSGSKIQQKVTQVLRLLESEPAPDEAAAIENGRKAKIIVLSAKAPVASKLIGIVEIVKRNMSKSGKAWYQYSIVQGRIEEHKSKKNGDESASREKAEGDEEDDGDFETMRNVEERKTVRTVPVITICLVREPVLELKAMYGEQMLKIESEGG